MILAMLLVSRSPLDLQKHSSPFTCAMAQASLRQDLQPKNVIHRADTRYHDILIRLDGRQQAFRA